MKNAYLNAIPKPLQTELPKAIPGREADMIDNSCGSKVFKVDDHVFLDRFLIMGAQTGSIGRNNRIVKESAEAFLALINQDAGKVITRVYELNKMKRVFVKDPSLLVLAFAMSQVYNKNPDLRRLASDTAATICKTPYELTRFIELSKEVAGHKGYLLVQTIAKWFNNKPAKDLAYQGVKYRSRNGWNARDLLKIGHPTPTGDDESSVMAYLIDPALPKAELARERFPIIKDYEDAMSLKPTQVNELLAIIQNNSGITWEMIPTEFLNDINVWSAFLPNLNFNALVRNISRFAANGFFKNQVFKEACIAKLLDKDAALKSGMHPFKIFLGQYVYSLGRGKSSTWSVDKDVLRVMEIAFINSVTGLRPTGKKVLVGVDVSASMTWEGSRMMGGEGPCAREFAAVFAYLLATACKFIDIEVGAFTSFPQGVKPIRPNDAIKGTDPTIGFTTLNIQWYKGPTALTKSTQGLPAGSTNCSAPIEYAIRNNMIVDSFVIITDNDINQGRHVAQAMADYRNKFNPNASMVVVTTQVCNYSVADPKDHLMLDVVGVDASGPEIVLDFISNV